MMKNNTYIPNYQDLINVPVQDNGEQMVPIIGIKKLRTRQIDPRMFTFTKNFIFVREKVRDMLGFASASQLLNKNEALEVVSGYRALEIQKNCFNVIFLKNKNKYPTLPDEELIQFTHKFIAYPEVAGHPTGGAVDIQIINIDTSKPLDFGSPIWSLVEKSMTFCPYVSKEAQENRMRLRSIMKNAGFAVYNGEWWHFNYGDREWGFLNEKPSIYGSIGFASDQSSLLAKHPATMLVSM